MKIAAIVAAAENRCIGADNGLPWHLPGDLQYFKRMTIGKPVIMGRKTWESIRKPLPGRTNIVITRNANYQAEGASVVCTINEALNIANNIAKADGVDEIMIVGGAGIYDLAMSQTDRLYFTKIHASVNGDAFFPELDWQQWQLTSQEDYSASDKNPYAYSFCVYDRAT